VLYAQFEYKGKYGGFPSAASMSGSLLLVWMCGRAQTE
jgi:hypothetical protein